MGRASSPRTTCPATNEFYALADTMDLEVIEAWFGRAQAHRAAGRAISLAVTTDSGKLIGQTTIGVENRVLSGTIGAAHRGMGLAQRVGPVTWEANGRKVTVMRWEHTNH